VQFIRKLTSLHSPTPSHKVEPLQACLTIKTGRLGWEEAIAEGQAEGTITAGGRGPPLLQLLSILVRSGAAVTRCWGWQEAEAQRVTGAAVPAIIKAVLDVRKEGEEVGDEGQIEEEQTQL